MITIYEYLCYVIEHLVKVIHRKPPRYPKSLVSSAVSLMISSSKAFNPTLSEQELRDGCRLGIDSHADVSCVGKHAHVFETFSGRTCNVQPFNDSYSPMLDIKTVNAAFAYDSDDGMTYILNVNQALDFTNTMVHSLLCPNQARMNGMVIDDVPMFLDR